MATELLHSPDEQQQQKLRELWIKVAQDPAALPDARPFLRPEIYASWQRSIEGKVDAQSETDTMLPEDQLNAALAQSSLLIEIAFPYLQNLYYYLADTNHVIQLCDRNGCVLKSLSNDKLVQALYRKMSARKEGYMVSEEVIGTNSTGLCLHTGEPAQVFGYEHFQQRNHLFSCSSAPLFNGANELIGCLTLTCPRKFYQQYTMGVLTTAVDAIQKELQLRQKNQQLITTINAQKTGMLLLDQQRNILYHNEQALSLLRLPSSYSLAGKNLNDILPPSAFPKELRALSTPRQNVEVTIPNDHGEPINLVISITIDNQDGQMPAIVLSMEAQRNVFQQTTSISGAYAAFTFKNLLGESPALRHVKELGYQAAQSDSTVLILGESGVGKELVAQAIHNASNRSQGPFLAINCGSLPRNLIESELFGYEQGAFTGANSSGHPGKFELADGGTIFLDEIGDLPFDLQATLLRVLQTREVTRLGGNHARKVDCRIISATNRNLLQSISTNLFREDLYYRLNVLSIVVPPLRDRLADIPILTEYFLHHYGELLGKEHLKISSEALDCLLNYSWPGNVRQLENTIERAVNFTSTSEILLQTLPSEIVQQPAYDESTASAAEPPAAPEVSDVSDRGSSPEIHEYRELIRLLTQERGHVKTVAQALGLPLSTLYGKLRKYSLNPKDYRKW